MLAIAPGFLLCQFASLMGLLPPNKKTVVTMPSSSSKCDKGGARPFVQQANSQRHRLPVEPRTDAHSSEQACRDKRAKLRASTMQRPPASMRSTKHTADVPMREPLGVGCIAKEARLAKRIRVAPSIARATLPMAQSAGTAWPSDEASASCDTPRCALRH